MLGYVSQSFVFFLSWSHGPAAPAVQCIVQEQGSRPANTCIRCSTMTLAVAALPSVGEDHWERITQRSQLGSAPLAARCCMLASRSRRTTPVHSPQHRSYRINPLDAPRASALHSLPPSPRARYSQPILAQRSHPAGRLNHPRSSGLSHPASCHAERSVTRGRHR